MSSGKTKALRWYLLDYTTPLEWSMSHELVSSMSEGYDNDDWLLYSHSGGSYLSTSWSYRNDT